MYSAEDVKRKRVRAGVADLKVNNQIKFQAVIRRNADDRIIAALGPLYDDPVCAELESARQWNRIRYESGIMS